MRKKLNITIIIMLVLSLLGGCSAKTAKTPIAQKMPEISIASSPGPVSYPLAYIQENNLLGEIADKTTVVSWSTADQLKGMVTSNQVQFAATPISNAMMLYNKGIDVKLVNVAVWGMVYVISTDDKLTSLEQLKGQEIAVAGKGGIHDLVLRHLLIKKNIDPDKDVKITYIDMAQASTKLLTKELKYAVLNEPNSSITLMNAKKNGVNLYRSIDLQVEWANMMGKADAKIPWAGFIAVGESAKNDALIKTFVDKIAISSKWINENAVPAGEVTEKYFQSMKAPAVSASIPFSRLSPLPASECQKAVEEFYTELLKTAPAESIGGKLPDAGLYYQRK